METIYNCRKDCCPEMYYDKENNNVIIKDDFGNKVVLTKEQFETLKSSYDDKFNKDK